MGTLKHGTFAMCHRSPSLRLEGPCQGAGPSPQLEGPCQGVGVHHPNSKGHAKTWESITPLKGPCQSVGVHHPNSRGHAKAWESIRSGPQVGLGATSPLLSGGSPTLQSGG